VFETPGGWRVRVRQHGGWRHFGAMLDLQAAKQAAKQGVLERVTAKPVVGPRDMPLTGREALRFIRGCTEGASHDAPSLALRTTCSNQFPAKFVENQGGQRGVA
jgi:hypothetical protein